MPPKTVYLNKTLDKKVKRFAKEKNLAIATALRILIKIGLSTANDERDINQLQKTSDAYRKLYLDIKNKVDEL